MAREGSGLTGIGKAVSILLMLGLVALGAWVLWTSSTPPRTLPAGPGPGATPQTPGAGGSTQPASAGLAAIGLADAHAEVPRLAPPAPYTPVDGIVDIELSEYAGYAGIIAANGGLEPSENSVFFKKHRFKVRIKLSEEESWSALNAGKMAASATTVDVLAVYGRQFNVVVPVQIGFSRGADGLVVRRELRRINALKGQVLVTGQFTEAEFFVRFLAQEAGIGVSVLTDPAASPNPEKINLVFAEDAFVAGDLFLKDLKESAGTLAGAVTWEPKTSEVAQESAGKAHVLTTNRNLLIVADVLIVNRAFAEQNAPMMAGLVDGVLEGNRLVRESLEAHLPVIAKAFGWDVPKARAELGKVHLSNGRENAAFFSGAIDMAGSFGGIYQSAVFAYGPELIKNPTGPERFLMLAPLNALEAAGAFSDEKMLIAPIRGAPGASVETDPLLSKDIRFLFQPNSAVLDQTDQQNLANLEAIKRLLQVSPGSTILLRGHVDDAQVEEFRQRGGDAFVRQMALKAVQLSMERAAEIRRLIIEKHGVDGARIETVGRGWDEPLGKDGEKNRRVEVQWFTVE